MEPTILISIPLKDFTALIKETIISCLSDKQAVENQLLDTHQLCKLLNVSDVTLMKWRKANKIPFIQIYRKIMYNKNDVMEALKQGKYLDKLKQTYPPLNKNTLVIDANFSTRTLNVIHDLCGRLGIVGQRFSTLTLLELSQWRERCLMKTRNAGYSVMNEIKRELAQVGLELDN